MMLDNSENVFFSIVIPCFNASKTIRRAVQSCIGQSFTQFEIIIIDDASSDDTLEVVASLIKENPNFQIKIIQLEKNSGPAKCRNIGLLEAKGDFIAFLDSDDSWVKNKLEVCYYWIRKLDCDFIAHSYIDDLVIDSHLMQPENYIPEMRKYTDLLIKNISQTSCIVVGRSLTNVEKFDSKMRYTEDHELWLRIIYNKPAYFLCGEALTRLNRPQLTKGGLSGNRWAMRKGEIKMYFKSAKYSKISFFLLPLLILFSLAKFIKKEIYLRAYRE